LETSNRNREDTPVRGILRRSYVALLLAVILLTGLSEPVGGQALQTQGLGRAYWHVFAAYAIAWALVLGWIVSIARRLARVEERLEGRPG
jgi:CcmD family protein